MKTTYVYDNMSLSSCQDEKCFTKTCRENQNTHVMFNNFLSENRAIYEISS